MTRKIAFYKKDNKWYANIPNHTEEENEMVMGADIALDYMSKGGDKVRLIVTDKETEVMSYYTNPLHFIMKEHEDDGAYYKIDGYEASNLIVNMKDLFGDMEPTVYLCNVMHTVFGEHPNELWVLEVETNALSKIEKKFMDMLMCVDKDYDVEAPEKYYRSLIKEFIPKILDGNTMWEIGRLIKETATVDYLGKTTYCSTIGEKSLKKLLKIYD